MKNNRIILYLIVLSLILFSQINAYCADYFKLYEKTELPKFKFHNNIDPYQNEDYFKYAYSPYPLFRTSSDLYFKSLRIPSGYYIITPRHYKNQDIVLFKSNGEVKFIVPVLDKDIVPVDFYKRNLPQVKLTKFQKFKKNIIQAINNHFKSSKKEEPPKSFIVVDKIAPNWCLIKLYYGPDIYIMLFSLVK